MSQVFSGDSVSQTSTVSVTTTAETPIVTGNFLNPPFGNAKAVLWCSVQTFASAGSTSVTLRIRRNPNAENLQVAISAPVATPAANQLLALVAADVIPDGRPVQYQLTLQFAGASANSNAAQGNISVVLISG
jgi:hypothetical protein